MNETPDPPKPPGTVSVMVEPVIVRFVQNEQSTPACRLRSTIVSVTVNGMPVGELPVLRMP